MRAEILAGLLAVACAACADSQGGTAARAVASADPRSDVLRDEIRRILDALAAGDERAARDRAADLALPRPRAWFAQTFWAAGDRIAAEYEPLAVELPQLVDALRPWLARGPVTVEVERFTDPADTAATGYQVAALAAMEKRVPLYSVRIEASGGDGGGPGVYHLWSFVDVDGAFRWIGKLRPLVGAPPGTGVDPLELRVRDRVPR